MIMNLTELLYGALIVLKVLGVIFVLLVSVAGAAIVAYLFFMIEIVKRMEFEGVFKNVDLSRIFKRKP